MNLMSINDSIETIDANHPVPAPKSTDQIERERLTRRQALRKIGITSTITVAALFTVDDIARLAGEALARISGDNKVANNVAKELTGMGLAYAGAPNGGHTNMSCNGQTMMQNILAGINPTWGSPGVQAKTPQSCEDDCIACGEYFVNGQYYHYPNMAKVSNTCAKQCTTYWCKVHPSDPQCNEDS